MRKQKDMPAGATGFEQTYPNIERWVTSHGWFEIGIVDYSQSLVRALEEAAARAEVRGRRGNQAVERLLTGARRPKETPLIL